MESGWAIPDESCIAQSLQNACEVRDEVLYPVYIESDTYHIDGPQTLVGWFRRLLQEELNVAPESCTYYFSGRRSIHVHVPKVVVGEADLRQLKTLITGFCEKTNADIDLAIYSRKRQFRLPGVVHQKTTLPKVEIDPEWNHEQIINAATGLSAPRPKTFADVLESTFGRWSGISGPNVARRRDNESVLTFEKHRNQKIATPLIEQVAIPTSEPELRLWDAYNRKEFSPYAHAGEDNGRSVAVVRILGGAFTRKEIRSGATLIPAYFYGAHGCIGREFTMFDCSAPLQLSKTDYRKWDFDTGDTLVVIGGRNRSSRLIKVDVGTALLAGHMLHPEEGSRQEALAFLEREGHDTGSSGSSTTGNPRPTRRRGDFEQVLPVDDPTVSESARLQWEAEQRGINTLTHDEILSVAFRLLTKYNWDPVWKWYRNQFGDDFNPEMTWQQLKSVVESYPDQRTHVEIPGRP
jgi:hypothetical protein